MSVMKQAHVRRLGPMAGVVVLGTAALLQSASGSGGAPPAPVVIAQIPLTVAIPAHPQVLIAMGNSESMDGDMDTTLPGGGGAIMTGSGALGGSSAPYLAASTSPVNYTIPSAFTPPVNPGAGGQAPYTVTSGGLQYDNSPSRLNIAKAGISAILNDFMEYADFGLVDYNTWGAGLYQTWVYYMSEPGGFTFHHSLRAGRDRVANPCYGVPLNGSTDLGNDCSAMDAHYGSIGINNYEYVEISASSDDPDINDVLYAGGLPTGWVNYDGPFPGNPYSIFSLWQYETGGVYDCYYASSPGGIGICETPTNAGYVPYSTEVMQFLRGFGYISGQSSNSGNTVVGMQSSGAAPTPASVSAAIAQFTPYLAAETNSTGTPEIKALSIQSPTAGLLAQARSYYANVNPSTSNGCSAQRYVVLVTDGLPTQDLNGYAWPPLGTLSSAGYGVSVNFNGDGSLNSTNDQALTDTITEIQALASAGVKTYVIGLGAGVETAYNPQAAATLTAMAIAGGTGSYFAATSPAALTNDMQVILAQILAATQSTASATVNTTGLNTNSIAFQPSFDTSDVNQDWTGDIKAYPINSTTGSVNTSSLVWSAQTQLDSQDSSGGWNTARLVATWDPAQNKGIPFRWVNISANATLAAELSSNLGDPNGQHAEQYLRGNPQWDIAHGGAYRTRTHILGDIVDSAPLYIGTANGPYQSASYYSFEATYGNREPVIYTGANDGMLHAFSAATGRELFAYVPNGVFSNLINLTSVYYNQQHHFYVDGSPQASDVQFSNGSWHTVLGQW